MPIEEAKTVVKLTFIESDLSSKEHFDACVKLTHENHRFHATKLGRGNPPSISQTREDILEDIKDRDVRAFFLKDGDKYVGGLFVIKDRTAKQFSNILDLYLKKPYRRLGAAKKLASMAFAWAKKKGSSTMYVRAVIKNSGALNFYQQEGFEPDTMTLRKKL